MVVKMLVKLLLIVSFYFNLVSNNSEASTSKTLVDLVGNFTYCDVRNEKSLVNMNMRCDILHSKRLMAGNKSQQHNYDVLVLSRIHFVIDTYGIECYSKKVIRYLNTSFFGVRSESIFFVHIHLTPIECIAMIQSQRCHSEHMQCSDDGCIYDHLPDGEFAWFQNVKLTTFNCKFHRRRVQGEKNSSILFSNAISSCLPPDLHCRMSSSIIVWNASDVRRFMYAHVHRSDSYTLKGNILYSNKTRYLFQLTDRIWEQGYELHKTTQGLYIYMVETKPYETNHSIDDLWGRLTKSISNHQLNVASLYELEQAEKDYEMQTLEDEFKHKFNQEFIKDCCIFMNQLNMLAQYDDQLHKIRDMKGREAFVYSRYGQLFVPKCEYFSELRVRTMLDDKQDECFASVKVQTIDRRNRSVSLFLNRKNFLLDISPRINCSSVNSRQLINTTHFLIRVRNQVKVQLIADLKLIDMTSQNYDFESLNFDHHGEIVDGFELIEDFHDKAASSSNNENDMNGNFHLLPEDNVDEKHHLLGEWAHHISNSISNIWETITNAIKTFIISIIIFFALIALAYLIKCCYKIRTAK